MKKLISIAVALALLAMVVLPVGVAAQCEYDPDGNGTIAPILPDTYAKIPFAIIESGLYLAADLMGKLATPLGLPVWLDDIFLALAPWAGGPLSWTVDMLGWGLGMVGAILTDLATTLGLPAWLDDLINTMVCQIFAPFSCNVTGAEFAPDCR